MQRIQLDDRNAIVVQPDPADPADHHHRGVERTQGASE